MSRTVYKVHQDVNLGSFKTYRLLGLDLRTYHELFGGLSGTDHGRRISIESSCLVGLILRNFLTRNLLITGFRFLQLIELDALILGSDLDRFLHISWRHKGLVLFWGSREFNFFSCLTLLRGFKIVHIEVLRMLHLLNLLHVLSIFAFVPF